MEYIKIRKDCLISAAITHMKIGEELYNEGDEIQAAMNYGIARSYEDMLLIYADYDIVKENEQYRKKVETWCYHYMQKKEISR